MAIVQRSAQDLAVCLSQQDEEALLSNPNSIRSVRPTPSRCPASQTTQQCRKHACFIPCIYLKNGPCWQDFLTPFSVLQVMNRRVWCNQGMHAHIRIFAMVVQEAVLCVPMDRRLPLLRLRSRHLLPLVKQRFVVRVDTWPRDSKHPTCHFVRSLGALNDMWCAVLLLLYQVGELPCQVSH